MIRVRVRVRACALECVCVCVRVCRSCFYSLCSHSCVRLTSLNARLFVDCISSLNSSASDLSLHWAAIGYAMCCARVYLILLEFGVSRIRDDDIGAVCRI